MQAHHTTPPFLQGFEGHVLPPILPWGRVFPAGAYDQGGELKQPGMAEGTWGQEVGVVRVTKD